MLDQQAQQAVIFAGVEPAGEGKAGRQNLARHIAAANRLIVVRQHVHSAHCVHCVHCAEDFALPPAYSNKYYSRYSLQFLKRATKHVCLIHLF
jgi:hypothetical protein